MYSIIDEKIIKYAPDYEVNLFAPESMSEKEIDKFRFSLKEIKAKTSGRKGAANMCAAIPRIAERFNLSPQRSEKEARKYRE